jgi:hypothetical protein
MIMKMVRRHPALKWLRSDLAENVSILQQERPDITFASKRGETIQVYVIEEWFQYVHAEKRHRQ